MKRKIFSKLLMVALVIAAVGSFVSCKDYDDDINNLQKQIDNAALKSSVEALQSTLDAKITAAQNAAAAAQTAADKAAATANAAVTKAQLDDAINAAKSAAATAANEYADKVATAAQTAAAKEAYDQAKKYVDDEVAKVTAAIPSEDAIKAIADASAAALDEKLATDLKAWVNEQIDAIDVEGQVEAAVAKAIEKIDTAADNVAAIWSAVTSVELYASLSDNFGLQKEYELLLLHGTEVESTFGDEVTPAASGSVTYTKDAEIKFDNSLIVRVNPANAEFTKEQVDIINSKGISLVDSGFVFVQNVEPYDGLITRGGSAAGLWKIDVVRSADKTDAQIKEAVQGKADNTSRILYAVAINNTTKEAADRLVASSFDLGVTYGEYFPAQDLFFDVNGQSVTGIKNRWDYANKRALGEDGSFGRDKENLELTWAADSIDDKGNVLPRVAGNKSKLPIPTAAVQNSTVKDADGEFITNAVLDAADDRHLKPVLVVNAFEPIVISNVWANDVWDADGEKQNIDAFIQYYYVTLDINNAVESNPSEKNIWPLYNISGLNKVTKATEKIEISINDKTAVKDIIGFRVFAVNYDGTLADPDGKAFYVKVGAGSKEEGKKEEIVVTGSDDSDVLVLAATSAAESSAAQAVAGATVFADGDQLKEIDSENPEIYEDENGTVPGDYDPFTVSFFSKADGTGAVTATGNNPGDLSTIKSFKIKYDPAKLLDGGTYTKKFAVVRWNNVQKTNADTLRYVTFKIQKTLPAALPSHVTMALASGVGTNNVITSFIEPAGVISGSDVTPYYPYAGNTTAYRLLADVAGDAKYATFSVRRNFFADMTAATKKAFEDDGRKVYMYINNLGISYSKASATTAGSYKLHATFKLYDAAPTTGLVLTKYADGKAYAAGDAFTMAKGKSENLKAAGTTTDVTLYDFLKGNNNTADVIIPNLGYIDNSTEYELMLAMNFGKISRPSEDGLEQDTDGATAQEWYGKGKKAGEGYGSGIKFKFSNWSDSYVFNTYGKYNAKDAYTDADGAHAAVTATIPGITVKLGNNWLGIDYQKVTGVSPNQSLTPAVRDFTLADVLATNNGGYVVTPAITDLSQCITGTDGAAAVNKLKLKTYGVFSDAAGKTLSNYYSATGTFDGTTAKIADKITLTANAANISADNWRGGTLYLVFVFDDTFTGDYFTGTWNNPTTAPAGTTWADYKYTARQKVVSLPITVNP